MLQPLGLFRFKKNRGRGNRQFFFAPLPPPEFDLWSAFSRNLISRVPLLLEFFCRLPLRLFFKWNSP